MTDAEGREVAAIERFVGKLREAIVTEVDTIEIGDIVRPQVTGQVGQLIVAEVERLQEMSILTRHGAFGNTLHTITREDERNHRRPRLEEYGRHGLQAIVRERYRCGIDAVVVVAVLKTRNLVVGEVHRSHHIDRLGIEDVGHLLELVVRAREELHIEIAEEVVVAILFPMAGDGLYLVIVEVYLGEVDTLAKGVEGFDLVVGAVEHGQLLHSAQVLVFGELLQIVVSHIENLQAVATLAVDDGFPVALELLAADAAVAGNVERLQFGHIGQQVQRQCRELRAVVDFYIGQRSHILPAPRLALTIEGRVLLDVDKEVLYGDGRVGNVDLLQLGKAHHGT